MVTCVAVTMATGGDLTPQEGTVIWWIGWSGIYATFVQWPFYIGWALLSRELNWRARVLWVTMIFAFNMFGMPLFLVCKYFGTAGRGFLPRRQTAPGER